MVTVWRTVLLLSCYHCDSTRQNYDVTRFENVLWRGTMHEWVMNIHYKTWIAQGRFINMIRTPSKQWGECDEISKLDIVENFLLGNTLIQKWLWQKHFINLYARFRHFNRVTLTNRSSETIYRVAYRILWKDNNGWQNYINLHKNFDIFCQTMYKKLINIHSLSYKQFRWNRK